MRYAIVSSVAILAFGIASSPLAFAEAYNLSATAFDSVRQVTVCTYRSPSGRYTAKEYIGQYPCPGVVSLNEPANCSNWNANAQGNANAAATGHATGQALGQAFGQLDEAMQAKQIAISECMDGAHAAGVVNLATELDIARKACKAGVSVSMRGRSDYEIRTAFREELAHQREKESRRARR
jgi:hypothetical protein